MDSERESRRNFMIRAIIGIAAFIGAAAAVPLAGLGILPVLRNKAAAWSDAGSFRDLQMNEPQERRFLEAVKHGWQEEKVERAVWLVRTSEGGVRAFSPSCPHLGCGYRWFAADRNFKCPCHASVFDIDGKVLAGPSPRGLDAFEAKVEDDRVFVKFEVFQVGTTSKVAA